MFGIGRLGGGQAYMALLMMEEVRQQLNITEDQMTKLREAGEKLREENRGLFEGLRDLPEDERQEKIRAAMAQIQAKGEENIKAVLSEAQMKRLKELELQWSLRIGVEVLLRDDVAKELGLSEEQKTKLQALVDQIAEKRREVFRGAGPGAQPEQFGQRMNELQAEARAEVQKILSEEQVGKLKAMLGEPFQFPAPRFGPGGFGRPGAGGPAAPGGPGGGTPRRGERVPRGPGGGRET